MRVMLPLPQLSRFSSQFICSLKREMERGVSDEPSKSASASEVKDTITGFKIDSKVNYRTVLKAQSGMNFIHLSL